MKIKGKLLLEKQVLGLTDLQPRKSLANQHCSVMEKEGKGGEEGGRGRQRRRDQKLAVRHKWDGQWGWHLAVTKPTSLGPLPQAALATQTPAATTPHRGAKMTGRGTTEICSRVTVLFPYSLLFTEIQTSTLLPESESPTWHTPHGPRHRSGKRV